MKENLETNPHGPGDKDVDVFEQTEQPIVKFDEDSIGTDFRGNTLPPTSCGLGEEVFERSIGTSSGGFRPTEEAVIDE